MNINVRGNSTNSQKTKKRNRNRSKRGPKARTAQPQNRRKQSRRAAVQAARQISPSFRLSPCSKDYLKALVNPFNNTLNNVCIPDLLDIQSAKFRLTARGTLATGTTGFGFIQIIPGGTPMSDANSIYNSGSTYTGTVTATSGTGVSASAMTQAPYDIADIGGTAATIQFRTVGCGVRVRYIGTELDRGGRYILYRPQGGASSNAADEATALANRTSITVPVTRRWCGISFLPQIPLDYAYSASNGFTSPRVALLIDSKAANMFEWEVVSHVEYIGAIAQTSPSHSDVVGQSAVREIINATNVVEEASDAVFDRMLNRIQSVGAAVFSSASAQKVAETYVYSKLGL